MYIKPIVGTSLLAIKAILLIPPMITSHKRIAKIRPVANLGIVNVDSITLAMLLICGIFPEPRAVIIIKAEKVIANHFIFNPSSMKYIGPPETVPSGRTRLYLCASVTSTNFVVMPKIAVTHIQKIAAGPPIHIAKATPPIFPVPTVPDNAVDNA